MDATLLVTLPLLAPQSAPYVASVIVIAEVHGTEHVPHAIGQAKLMVILQDAPGLFEFWHPLRSVTLVTVAPPPKHHDWERSWPLAAWV